ncbi:hypothetical protein ACPRNU_22560 [Chromobacterium vaccinii]|uniref:hypothetical protein n=1 Tax=Chromobacterium vaccinii TaxID=1108595 RepID=UPI003C776425
MKIIMKATSAELGEMGVTKEELKGLVIQPLDEATLSNHAPAVELCGYDVTINVVDR